MLVCIKFCINSVHKLNLKQLNQKTKNTIGFIWLDFSLHDCERQMTENLQLIKLLPKKCKVRHDHDDGHLVQTV